jgi:hypothetical protein
VDFANQTRLPAHLVRGIVRGDEMFGSLVVRATWDIGPGGRLALAAEQPWRVSPGPWDGPAGPMPGDELFYRGGVDVFVFGSARAPEGKTAARLDVSIAIGERFRHTVAVFGDRIWERRLFSVVPGEPAPFVEMPLALARAFGGKDVWDELSIPYPDNPDGRGFYLERGNALGRPLPNIEDPAHPVAEWSDRPEPVGMGAPPASFGPRLRRSLRFNPATGMLEHLDPAFFNHAFPGMIAPKDVKPGDLVRLENVRPDGPLCFTLPPCPVEMRLRIGERRLAAFPAIDQIGIEPDRLRAFVTYRHPFRYRMVPMEKRECSLVDASAPTASS